MTYISREAAIGKITALINKSGKYTAYESGADDACYIVEHEIPAAVVRPVVRGEWIETGYFDQAYQPIYECSHCHGEVADSFVAKHLFCLHCGADMRPEGRAKE